ncbi:MAG TPA: NYN domain-containing protein [Candidatus Saccharimonadales bacterium]
MRSRFRKPKQVYAFIDSQNLNLGTQRMGWKVDWRKFRQFLRVEYAVTKAFTFIGYMPENESLYEYMHSLGYLVVLKPTLEINGPAKDENGAPKPGSRDPKDKTLIKGNVDTEVVLTAMKEINNYTKAIIVSADGDFYSLIEHLASKNKLLHVLTPSWQYSTLLKEFEPYIVNLDKYKSRLSYQTVKRKK